MLATRAGARPATIVAASCRSPPIGGRDAPSTPRYAARHVRSRRRRIAAATSTATVPVRQSPRAPTSPEPRDAPLDGAAIRSSARRAAAARSILAAILERRTRRGVKTEAAASHSCRQSPDAALETRVCRFPRGRVDDDRRCPIVNLALEVGDCRSRLNAARSRRVSSCSRGGMGTGQQRGGGDDG